MTNLTYSTPTKLKIQLAKLLTSCLANVDFSLNHSFIKSQRPIFIVGCGHSGTSILHRLLGMHTDVLQIPAETNWYLKDKLDFTNKQEILSYCRVMKHFQAGRLLEKTPRHILRIQAIRKTFPNSSFVVIFRDPRDVAASMKARGFDLKYTLNRWLESTRIALNICDEDWATLVSLEQLVDHPTSIMHSLQIRLDLPPQQLVEAHEAVKKNYYSRRLEKPESVMDGLEHTQYRNWQINQPIFKSTNRWHKDLTKSEASMIWSETKQWHDDLSTKSLQLTESGYRGKDG